jgi:hypothetical protein
MEIPEQEMLRRALTAILKRIEGDGSTPPVLSDRTDRATDPPVVLVFLGQAGTTNQGPYHEKQPSHPSSLSHPGLERFQRLESPASDVPKSCFMEPDRVCVNSGACEMLGH